MYVPRDSKPTSLYLNLELLNRMRCTIQIFTDLHLYREARTSDCNDDVNKHSETADVHRNATHTHTHTHF